MNNLLTLTLLAISMPMFLPANVSGQVTGSFSSATISWTLNAPPPGGFFNGDAKGLVRNINQPNQTVWIKFVLYEKNSDGSNTLIDDQLGWAETHVTKIHNRTYAFHRSTLPPAGSYFVRAHYMLDLGNGNAAELDRIDTSIITLQADGTVVGGGQGGGA